MSELIVLAFDTETGAAELNTLLKQFQEQGAIELDDAAIVTRRPDGKARIKQAENLVGEGALGGAFWGMFIGLLFFMPWMGLALGAITGALAGKFSDTGIPDTFIKEVSEAVPSGGSALFLMVRKLNDETILEQIKAFHPTILRTSLTAEQQEKLKAAFGAGE
jgi:uncharacterized membrane protein